MYRISGGGGWCPKLMDATLNNNEWIEFSLPGTTKITRIDVQGMVLLFTHHMENIMHITILFYECNLHVRKSN